MIQAILFDKDGTLFDFYGTWGVVTEEAALLAADGDAVRAAEVMLRSGKDPKTGYARNPFDNVGVQYGLKAYNQGLIGFDE